MDTLSLTPAEKVVEAILAYYRQAEILSQSSITEALAVWYLALSTRTKAEVDLIVPSLWSALPGFKRFLLENNGFSMQAFMQDNLAPDDLTHWVDDLEWGTLTP